MSSPRTFAQNRRARFEYDILETFEAGLVLMGTEIKSVREGQVSIAEAYARPEGGELWLVSAHIAPYSSGSRSNHDPGRPRKLLLHRDQLAHLSMQVKAKGLTIVPLRVYLKGRLAKVEIALARGRKRYDKRQAIIEAEKEREARQAVGARARTPA